MVREYSRPPEPEFQYRYRELCPVRLVREGEPYVAPAPVISLMSNQCTPDYKKSLTRSGLFPP